MNQKAQGTIEYLVIIAIIVVIALVVVSITTSIFENNAQGVANNTNQISSKTGPISVVDAATDSSGNTILTVNYHTIKGVASL